MKYGNSGYMHLPFMQYQLSENMPQRNLVISISSLSFLNVTSAVFITPKPFMSVLPVESKLGTYFSKQPPVIKIHIRKNWKQQLPHFRQVLFQKFVIVFMTLASLKNIFLRCWSSIPLGKEHRLDKIYLIVLKNWRHFYMDSYEKRLSWAKISILS